MVVKLFGEGGFLVFLGGEEAEEGGVCGCKWRRMK